MEVVDYENIVEVPLNVADSNNAGAFTVSNIPGVNSPMIDANVSVNNLPEGEDITPDLVGRSTDIVFSATDSDTVARTAGAIKLADGTSLSINSGNTGNISAVTYVYYDGTTTLKKTTTPQDAVGTGKIMVCVAKNSTSPAKAQFQAFGTIGNGVFITADNIAADAVTANAIAANSISAAKLTFTAVTPGTGANSVSSDGYVTSIDGNSITVSNVIASSVAAENITGTTITGKTLQTGTTGKRVVISSTNNRLDFYNSDDVLSGQIAGAKVGSTQVLALGSSGYIYSSTTHLTQHLYPLSGASYDLGGSGLEYRNLYISGVLDFDSGDGQLSEVSGYPKWSASGGSTYYIPLLTGASTNKTTNASIKMNFGGTEYYINVLAV